MEIDRIAQTSLWTAAARARESARPDRLFEDPFAAALAGPEGFALLDAEPPESRDNPYIAIRTRFFDDWLRRVAGEDSLHQVVLLGAGMDSRAFRLRWLPGTTLYELDRPELLALKQERLDSIGAEPACDRRPVGVDLMSDSFADHLRGSGFDPTQPSVWLAEGFFEYLDEFGVHRVLAALENLTSPGSRLGADFLSRDFLESPWMASYLARLRERGTPWQFGTNEPEVILAQHGWVATEVRQPGEEGANFGRWPWPVAPRSVAGLLRSFLVTAIRPA
jgi:methyltransferase (TIGR00027 family)